MVDDELAVPGAWSTGARTAFFDLVRKAKRPLLLCDYDGTLAPFQRDKMQARPYPGVVERLEQIAQGRSQLAFISGRPVGELIALLPLAASSEIWGMHGREHRTAQGLYRLMEPTPQQRDALDAAQAMLEGEGLEDLLERKAASLALHWRALDPASESARLREVRQLASEAFAPHAGKHALAVLPFDGGLELRAEDQTKADAVQAVLASEGGEADPKCAAFLGDDTTDEDAFRVLNGVGGLALLVREPPRPSYAHYVLRPPQELLAFLDDWLEAGA